MNVEYAANCACGAFTAARHVSIHRPQSLRRCCPGMVIGDQLDGGKITRGFKAICNPASITFDSELFQRFRRAHFLLVMGDAPGSARHHACGFENITHPSHDSSETLLCST